VKEKLKMKLISTDIKDVVIIEPVVHGDSRGYFVESFQQEKFWELGVDHKFIQDNQSLSALPGTLRGLHYQLKPKAQTKLVRVVQGAVYDVVVDLRKNSSTFGQHVGVILSSENHRQLLVPKGFAHGICTLTPNTILMYKVDEYYSPENDRSIMWNDPDLGIEWPVRKPVVSEKDANAQLFREAEINF